MKIFISALILLFICSVVCASPTIEFTQKVVDIGDVTEGVKTTAIFKFTNKGNQNLEIKKLSSTCSSCTELKAVPKIIEPGKSGKIIFKFTPYGGGSIYSKNVIAETNDPENPSIILNLMCNVIAIAAISPDNINFGSLAVKTTKEYIIKITPIKKDGFKIKKVTASSKHLNVFCKKEKGTYKLRVILKTGNIPGRIYEKIIIKTMAKGNPTYTVLVYGNVVGK